MSPEHKLELLLEEARAALAAIDGPDRTVSALVDRVGSLRYSEGRLVGFLEALGLTDPVAAKAVAPKISEFISEAIAAKLLLG